MICVSSPFKRSQSADSRHAWGEFTCREPECPTFRRQVLLLFTVVNRQLISGTKSCLAPDAAELIPKLDSTGEYMHHKTCIEPDLLC